MTTRFGDGRDWFLDAKFGMFVHWGLYAIPAWHEQVQWRRSIPRAEYGKLIHQFNPVRFDPDAWLDLAQRTGMEYICLTAKHHDGFCLWNTAQTPFNVMRSPYGRDIVGLLAEACRRRRFPLCLYYSVVDWHHPHYPNQNRSHELAGPEPGDEPNLERYLDFLRAQVGELCRQYGALRGFWWDMNVTERRDPSINAMIRSLQPDAVINNRGFDDGDFGTPEREYADASRDEAVFRRPTEACNSLGAWSWGYKEDEDYFGDRLLMAGIADSLARDGRFLLNVGPKADGTIPQEQTAILARIGAWYGRVREAFNGTTPSPELAQSEGARLMRRGNTVYVVLVKPPAHGAAVLKPLASVPRRATLLNTGATVDTRLDAITYLYPDTRPYLRLRNLPVNELAATVPVIKLEFDRL
jgi:alpha-L-fucosidase